MADTMKRGDFVGEGSLLDRYGDTDKTIAWYDEKLILSWPARQLLERYSGYAPEEVEKAVVELRDRAWSIYPYPCIGQFDFLDFQLSQRNDIYPALLARLKGGAKLLDIGCCLGHDIRKLIFDGVPSGNLVGAELNQGYIDAGRELFRDQDKTEARFIQANVLDNDGPLKELEGQFDVVSFGMFLHLFTWDEQVAVFERGIKSLKAGELGTTIIGNACGATEGVIINFIGKDVPMHSVETFAKLIKDVEAKTGTKWDLKSDLDTGISVFDGKRHWADPRMRRITFELTRLA